MSLTEQKVALITGGQGDLALALVRVLEDAGFSVLHPGKTELNVSDGDQIQAYFKPLDRIDLLINNAGITLDRTLLKLDEADWDSVQEVNLRGAFLCSRAALRLMMKQRSGHIINIGSFSGSCPPVGQSNYAASKAGLIGLTQSLAAEVGKRNIRVNCVLPGFLETKMTAELSENVVDAARERHTLSKFNTVDDAAKFIGFLDTMENVSGQVFQLDSRVRRWT